MFEAKTIGRKGSLKRPCGRHNGSQQRLTIKRPLRRFPFAEGALLADPSPFPLIRLKRTKKDVHRRTNHEEAGMQRSKLFLPTSIIGFIFLSIVVGYARWDFSNIWIPISFLFLAVGVLVYVIRETFKTIEEKFLSIEERLKKLEEPSNK